jgi:hypothetical protein
MTEVQQKHALYGSVRTLYYPTNIASSNASTIHGDISAHVLTPIPNTIDVVIVTGINMIVVAHSVLIVESKKPQSGAQKFFKQG